MIHTNSIHTILACLFNTEFLCYLQCAAKRIPTLQSRTLGEMVNTDGSSLFQDV